MVNDSDDGGDAERDTGGFVFGEERATDDAATADGFTAGTVAVIVLLVIAVVVLASVAQPFVMNAVAGLFGDGSETDIGNTTTDTRTVDTENTTLTGSPTATPPPPSTISTRTSVSTGTSIPARTSTPTATSTPARTSTPTATSTPTPTGGGTDDGETSGTDTGERSPVIETFTVTDRSSGGTATFDVAWNVTDPDSDLVAVRVSLVADPDGEARTIEQRRFDAGGTRTTGSTTFDVPEGGGAVYEVRIVAVDENGNTAFELVRAVADGSPDE